MTAEHVFPKVPAHEKEQGRGALCLEVVRVPPRSDRLRDRRVPTIRQSDLPEEAFFQTQTQIGVLPKDTVDRSD